MSIIATLGILTAAAHAAPVEVTAPGASQDISVYADLASAIAGAQDGSTLTLSPGNHGDVQIDGGRHLILQSGENATIDSLRIDDEATRVEARGLYISGSERAIEVRSGTLILTDSAMINCGSEDSGFAIAARDGAIVSMQRVEIADSRGTNGVVIADEGSLMGIIDSTLTNNEAKQGGAIYATGAEVGLRNVTLSGNTAARMGGAIAVQDSNMNLDNVRIQSGSADLGAGIYVGGGATLTGTDVDLRDNTANEGGQLYARDATVSLTRSTLTGGKAMVGAGVNAGDSTVRLTNTLFNGQVAAGSGGALYQDGGEVTVRFATMTDNTATIGAGVASEGGQMTLQGIIIAVSDGEAIANAGGQVTLNDSLVVGIDSGVAVVGAVLTGRTVIDAAPGFVSAESGDYALRLDSPALDAGLNGAADPDNTPADWGMYGGEDAWLLGDIDGDGYVHGRDCDDTDADINEHAIDRWYDGLDSNCDQADDFDQDGDGWTAGQLGGADCDDTNADINPGSVETTGDKFDLDCDGLADPDMDNDGWPSSVDCDDNDGQVNPGASERFYDGVDADCDGMSDWDQDGDGYESVTYGGEDCDDEDAFVNPATPEINDDNIDQDCDGIDATADAADGTDETVRPDVSSPAYDVAADDGSMNTGCSTVSGSQAGLVGMLLALGLLARRRED